MQSLEKLMPCTIVLKNKILLYIYAYGMLSRDKTSFKPHLDPSWCSGGHKPAQDVPQWDVDYFMLKATETLWAQKKLWPFPQYLEFE